MDTVLPLDLSTPPPFLRLPAEFDDNDDDDDDVGAGGGGGGTRHSNPTAALWIVIPRSRSAGK
jgi:hypothetical protein